MKQKKLMKKIEELCLVQMGDKTRKRLSKKDPVLKKNIADAEWMEEKLNHLKLTEHQRIIVEDYVAFCETGWSRTADLSYLAGIHDAIVIFEYLGLLKKKSVL